MIVSEYETTDDVASVVRYCVWPWERLWWMLIIYGGYYNPNIYKEYIKE